ncbi:hypothetical protein ABIB40_002146 [Pedobacter sp. UYP30]|uniref:hypothetical protein n=1 Tax=Pedobacter sp. UYP30 TaxID=1756400 RepID=UPI0033980A4C
MKNTFIKVASICISIASLTYLSSCKKGSKNAPSNEEILNNKIEEVIPQQYLDTLKKLNFTLNEGTTPPNMEGAYFADNLTLKASNWAPDTEGEHFLSSKFKIFNQSTKDFGVSLIGEHFLTARDTSIVTAISGSGNNFTLYGKVKSTTAPYSAIFAVIISGTKEGNDIKNYTIGLINIDNTNGDSGTFLPQGKARIIYDSDYTSEGIDYDTKVSSLPPNVKVLSKSAGEIQIENN